MPITDQLAQPEFNKPNLSTGAKVAEVFGNSNQANTQRAAADFKNQLAMTNYNYELNNMTMDKQYSMYMDSLRDSPSAQIEGYTKAGINPLMADVSSQGMQASAMSAGASAPQNVKNTSRNGNISDMLKVINKVANQFSDKAIEILKAIM